MNENPIRYIDERECTKISGIATQTLRNNRFNRRGIPYIKIGRSVRYSLKDIIEYMERRKIKTEDL